MRRLLIYLFCALPFFASASNELSLSVGSGHPGDTLTLTASMSNTDAVSALQATIPLNAHLKYINGSISLVSARSNGHTIYAATDRDTLYVTILSLANNIIVGNSGELFSFKVVLGNEPATYALVPQVTMAGTSAQTLPSGVSAGSITLLSPKIQVVTTTIDYGHIPIRATYSQTLQARNVGNEPLLISNMEFSAPEFSVATTSLTIPAGSSQNITVNYAPTQRGAVSESVRLRSNAVNDANVYSANLAILNADPYSVNELRVQPTSGVSDDTVTVTLRMNNMETDLVGAQVMFRLPEQLVFVEGSPVALSRAGSMSIVSSFLNDTLSLFLYSLNNTPIADTDGDLLTFRLRLNGRSGSYRLNPLNTKIVNMAGENLVSAVYAANVTIQSPTISGNSSLSFGDIPVTMRDTVSYSIRNTGQVPLIVERATFLMEGFRVVSPLPMTIERGASSSIQVEYTPTVEGNFSTTMQVYSNDPACRMKSVAVTATVFEPNSLSLSGSQQPDDSYLLSVEMDNYTAIPGVQFSITCPDGMTPSTFTPASRAQSLSVAMQPEGQNAWIVLLYSLSGGEITRGSGSIGTFTFSAVEAKAHVGEIISLSGIVLSDVKSNNRYTGTTPPHIIRYRYVASFIDEDSTLLQRDTLDYGATPAYRGTIPTKEATAQYTYTFNNWTPAIVPLTENATYTATYTAKVNKYVVTFVNEDSTLLQRDSIEYGTLPEYRGATPTKAATVQYTYTFNGWNNEIVSVVGDATYRATYTSTVNNYVVIFQNENGTLLQRDTLDYGTLPAYRGETPTKATTAQYTYSFAGWTPNVASVVGDATYTATFNSVVNRYVIMFLNEDSTLLQIDTLAYGTMPEYRGTTPTKAATAQYTFMFNGWNPAIVSVTDEAIYIATFTSTTNKYLITFQDENGTMLQQDSVAYGTLPVYREATPTKAATAQYTYSFAGWNPSVVNVIADATYTATYDSVVNKYVVMFLNEDSTLLQLDTLEYGTLPEFRGTTPTKQATAQYTYKFNGWNNAIVSVTGDATYLAAYTSTLNKYHIVFQNEDGTLLQRDTLEYGTLPVYRGTTPTKAATAQYTYTFNNWNPSVVDVIENATYTATYDSVVNTYVIMFLNEDSTLLQLDTLAYGSLPEYRGTTPTKQATAQYTYAFAGWNTAVMPVQGNATYLATYTSTTNKYLIIFQNEEGAILQTDSLEYGLLPTYRGETPSKAATAQYTYTFTGWNPSVMNVIADATYTATYVSVVNKYVVIFQNEDGNVLQRDTLNYGATPVYREANPTKESTAEATYTFAGWTPSITAVVEDVVYTATYDSVVNTYVVMFLNEDNTLLQIDTLEYGAMPEYRGEDPVKPNEGDYFYVFTGWEPEVVAVVGDAVYIATYESHGTGFDNVAEKRKPVKVLEDGKMYILMPDGTKYSATSKKVE